MSDLISYDAFGDTRALHAIFQPTTVAILGATGPNTLGEKALAGLTAGGFERLLVAVDPGERPNAFGISVCRALDDVPTPVDLAVVATPREETLEAIETCVAAGVKGIVVLTGVAGSAERRLEFDRQIRDRLRGNRIKLIGPGCGALMNPSINLNVSAGLPMPVAGNVALITQSGSLARALIDWSHKGIVGFSAFVSLGDPIDVGWGNLIDYFGSDRTTRAILIHMESIGNMRSFLSAARAVALQKPIIVTKAGRTEDAARVFSWHRNCAVIDDEVFDAALRRVGVIRVNDIEDLFHVGDALSKQPRPRGSRLAIVSNSGATGVLAADQAVAVGTLAPEPDEPSRSLSASPLSVTVEQSLDVLGDGSSRPFLETVEKAIRDPENDALLVVLVPQAMSDAASAIHGLLAMKFGGKPVLLCLPGPPAVPAEQEVLVRAVLPVFPSIGSAARTFNYMWRYSHDLRAIYETPELHADAADRELRQQAGALILQAQQRGGDLSDEETTRVLAAYGIASLRSNRQREPVDRYALQVGSRVDPEFGPVLWFDVGGQLFELMTARVVGLPPLNATLARRMLERSAIFDGLHRLAERNAVNLAAIDAALVRLSQLIGEQPAIREVSIDPLNTSAEGTSAGGARIAVYGAAFDDIPKPVFRPYPVQYVSTWATKHGLTITIRPIRAEDEPLMVAFHGQLSESAVYLRYFQVVKLARRTAHDALTRVCFGDYDREMVLVAERRGESPADREILAMASLTKLPRRNHGEVAVLVTDRYQRHGLGRELVRRLVEVARDERLDKVVASTMVDNRGMVAVFDRLGFTATVHDDEVRVELDVRHNADQLRT